jgi:hypothetical protein
MIPKEHIALLAQMIGQEINAPVGTDLKPLQAILQAEFSAIRSAVLEEAAKVADAYGPPEEGRDFGHWDGVTSKAIASAIRSRIHGD